MDRINRIKAQAIELFRSMTPGARLTAGLLLAVVVLSLGFLFRREPAAPDVYLLGGHAFPSDDMPKALAAFGRAGLGDFDVEGNLIRIPRARQAEYLDALAAADALPAAYGELLLKTIQEASPFTTAEQRDELTKAARQQMLADAIREISGIESATVFFDERRQGGLHGDKLSTAVVSVRPSPGTTLDAERVRAIRDHVTYAIAGLQPSQVTVVDRSTSKSWSGELLSVDEDPILARTKAYQEQFREEILALLAHVPGVRVNVHVELSRPNRETTQDGATPTLRPDTTESPPVGQAAAWASLSRRSGEPIQTANRPANVDAARSTLADSWFGDGSRDDAPTDVRAGGRPADSNLDLKKVTVAIGLPSDYLEQLWLGRTRAQTAAGRRRPAESDLAAVFEEESARIRQAVFQFVPHDELATPDKVVAVNRFTPPTEIPAPAPSFGERVQSWLKSNWAMLAMVAMACASLAMLRSFVRGAAPDRLSADTLGHSADWEPLATRDTPQPPGDLEQLVRANPEAAASVLKSWIGTSN